MVGELVNCRERVEGWGRSPLGLQKQELEVTE